MDDYEITNDPLIQRGGYTQPGKYDELFSKLTREHNCIVLKDWKAVNRLCGALDDFIKRRKITGAKSKGTKAYPTDGKPRVWLVYPPVVKTELRGPFPGKAK